MSALNMTVILLVANVLFCCDFVSSESNSTEGEMCTTNGDVCKKLKDCSFFNYEDIKRGVFKPPVCGFLGSEPVVCCTKHFNKMFGFNRKTKSAEVCEKYEHQICSNNRTRNDFSLEEQTIPPFMVLTGYGPESNITWNCGGSVISPRFVLSAAQCSFLKDLGPAKWIQVGDLQRKLKSQLFSIVSRYNHPNYKKGSIYNDIALFKLNKEIIFNQNVRPVCLHQSTSILTHNTVYVSGKGANNSNGTKNSKVMTLKLDLLPYRKCNISTFSEKLPDGFSKNGMICAGNGEEDGRECPEDYGGPMFLIPSDSRNGEFGDGCFLNTQVGLTTSPYQCRNEKIPGVYTNVGNYIHWIELFVWPDDNSFGSSFTVWV